MPIVQPPAWDESELAAEASESRAQFREERMQEPLEQYIEQFDESSARVEDVLEASFDLLNLRDSLYDILMDDWGNINAVRYLSSPGISLDDLAVLVDGVVSEKTVRNSPEFARTISDTVMLGLDRYRFPWVGEEREPTHAERLAAVTSTSALIATQRVQTLRRNTSKKSQEQAVKDRLLSDGFVEVLARDISNYTKAPDEGTFCGESSVAGDKADIVVRLWDGRVMPIECKVSNSSVNSVKRLNREAAAKARTWLNSFGNANIVPAVVISGVFKTHNLVQAQETGLTIFWGHNLDALSDFIESTRP